MNRLVITVAWLILCLSGCTQPSINADPKEDSILYLEGLHLERNGQWQEAILRYSQAEKEFPGYIKAIGNRGRCKREVAQILTRIDFSRISQESINLNQEAIKDLTYALKYIKREDMISSYRGNLCLCYSELKEFNKADQIINDMISQKPNSGELYFIKGRIETLKGLNEAAKGNESQWRRYLIEATQLFEKAKMLDHGLQEKVNKAIQSIQEGLMKG